jgi:heterotetrameric sarcosine oxidase delta subunit
MLIHCPHCGARSVEEFQFRHFVPTPSPDPVEALFIRKNHPELSVEYWQHVHGCRAWLKLQRNPSTAQVQSVTLLGAAP